MEKPQNETTPAEAGAIFTPMSRQTDSDTRTFPQNTRNPEVASSGWITKPELFSIAAIIAVQAYCKLMTGYWFLELVQKVWGS